MSRAILLVIVIAAIHTDFQSMGCSRRPTKRVTTYTTGSKRDNVPATCTSDAECMTPPSCFSRHRDAASDVLQDTVLFSCGADAVCCPTPVSAHRNRRLMSDDCGGAATTSLGNRIALGKTVHWVDLPWMARIGVASMSRVIQYVCGGSVISKRYVLTAAHCVVNVSKVYEVHLVDKHATQSINDEDDEDSLDEVHNAFPAQMQVSRISIHPDYNNNTLKNDIALLRLKTDVDVQPICLFGGDGVGKEGTNYSVAGWGMTGVSMAVSRRLQRADVQGITLEDCNMLAPRRFDPTGHVGATQLCANNYNMGLTCKGDSGGPLMAATGAGRVAVVGLVSYGFGSCDASKSASVFTRVQPYLAWILNNIEK